MSKYLIVVFTLLPALELYGLIKVGSAIGAGNTILLIILTGVTGATLSRLQGLLILQEIQESLDRGIIPNSKLMDGVMILVGGILLLTPGFITDILGFLFLIPLSRRLIQGLVLARWTHMMKRGKNVHMMSFRRNPYNRYEDIDI